MYEDLVEESVFEHEIELSFSETDDGVENINF